MKLFLIAVVLIAIAAGLLYFFKDRASPEERMAAVVGVRENKGVFLDVRELHEHSVGKVKGTLVFPTSKFGSPEYEAFVATLPKDKTIYTYCAVGGRAGRFVEDLRSRGFRAENAGGFANLKAAGVAVE